MEQLKNFAVDGNGNGLSYDEAKHSIKPVLCPFCGDEVRFYEVGDCLKWVCGCEEIGELVLEEERS